jgi:hypothetical protein
LVAKVLPVILPLMRFHAVARALRASPLGMQEFLGVISF